MTCQPGHKGFAVRRATCNPRRTKSVAVHFCHPLTASGVPESWPEFGFIMISNDKQWDEGPPSWPKIAAVTASVHGNDGNDDRTTLGRRGKLHFAPWHFRQRLVAPGDALPRINVFKNHFRFRGASQLVTGNWNHLYLGFPALSRGILGYIRDIIGLQQGCNMVVPAHLSGASMCQISRTTAALDSDLRLQLYLRFEPGQCRQRLACPGHRTGAASMRRSGLKFYQQMGV